MITLPHSVRFAHPETGPVVEVDHQVGSARIHLHGAHLTSWRPCGLGEQLWMSSASEFGPGAAIRGGVPICFPWFAMGPGDWEPQHGFARRVRWRLLGARQSRDEVTVVLALDERDLAADTPGRDRWPYRFGLEFEVTLTATDLRMSLLVTNTGDEDLPVSGALHTYLAIGDITATRIEGLDDLTCFDKVSGTALAPTEEPELAITAQTDRVYVHPDGAAHQVTVRGQHSTLRVRNESSHTVLWNPWQDKAEAMGDFPDDGWRDMVCLEAALPMEASGEWPVTLQPGAQHAVVQQLRVGSDDRRARIRPGS